MMQRMPPKRNYNLCQRLLEIKATNGYKQRSSKMEIQFSSEVNNFIWSAEHHAVVQKQGFGNRAMSVCRNDGQPMTNPSHN